MSKLKYLVMGIDGQALGGLVGALANGELDGQAEVLVMPTPAPQVYHTDRAGVVRQIDFETFLNAAVQTEKTRRLNAMPGEKLIKDIVKARADKEAEKAVNQ